MSDLLDKHDLINSRAALIAKISITEIIERTAPLIERECETEFKLKLQRSMTDKDRLLLRKSALKVCADYLENAIKTMDDYYRLEG